MSTTPKDDGGADERTEYFTVVFKGDVRKLPGNPMTTETVFGPVVAICVGDALDQLDRALLSARKA